MQNKWLRLTRTRGGEKLDTVAINFETISNVESAEGYPAFRNAGARLVYNDNSVIFVTESAESIMDALGAAKVA